MKLKDLKGVEDSLARLLGSPDLPVRIGFRLRPFTRTVLKHLNNLEESRQELVKKYGEPIKGEDGTESLQVKKNLKIFTEEFQMLQEEEVSLPNITKIKVSEIDEKVKLSAIDLENLGFLFEDEEEKVQAS